VRACTHFFGSLQYYYGGPLDTAMKIVKGEGVRGLFKVLHLRHLLPRARVFCFLVPVLVRLIRVRRAANDAAVGHEEG
jgi:hypothetical protein